MSITTDRLHFTGHGDADRLLVEEPLALLIGFALDQQVTVQKAFSGPLDLRIRLGHLDAARIAAMDPATLDRVFRERAALHRFPGAMATRVHTCVGSLPTPTATTQGGSGGRRRTDGTSGTACGRCPGSVR